MEREEVPMRIVGGLDLHRRQITFDYADERSGQIRRGRIAPADRMMLRRWLETTVGDSPAVFAVEACTGWRFVVEELRRAGIEAHLAEPADTAAARGPKRRAKTDRTDARHLRELLAAGRLPESWIAPEQVCEMRARLQLFKDLRAEHTAWVQRIHAILLHQGAPAIAGDLLGADNRRRLAAGEQLSPAGGEAVAAALRVLDALDAELGPLRRQIAAFARRQPRLQGAAGPLRHRRGHRGRAVGRTG
jgi:transposase